MDVNGNDNGPEWGYCTAPGCTAAAYPIWLSGEYPDDPDLLLCETHIGAEIARLRDVLDAVRDYTPEPERVQTDRQCDHHLRCRDESEKRVSEPTDLIRENAELRRRLDSVMHAGDMEHARMAALLGAATDLLNVLATLRYPDMASLWQIGGSSLENAYQAMGRSAVAVRPQADALLARLADLSRMVGEQNTTIGYQDAMLTEMRKTLGAAYHGLMSYACGNNATELAEEMAAEITRVLGKASTE